MNKELIYQNKKITYQVFGNGKPVMLIHGFGEEANIWESLAPTNSPQGGGLASEQTTITNNSLLINQFKFIIPDLPGSGDSEMIDDMSMEGMAEVMKVIMEREAPLELRSQPSQNSVVPQGGTLDPDSSTIHYSNQNSQEQIATSEISDAKNPLTGSRAERREGTKFGGARGAFIGHSMGGYIVLALVKKYPECVSAFSLFHSSAFADSEEKKATRLKGIEFINQHGAFEFLKTATPNLFSPVTKEKTPELIDQQVARLHNFSAPVLVSYYEAMMQRPDRTSVLRQATVPVLFIMGKYDLAVPVEDGLKQCHLPEKSYIHVLQHSGHMGMLEEPLLCNRIVEDFLLDL